MLFCPFVSFILITLRRFWPSHLSFPFFHEKLFFPELLEQGVQYSFSQCTEIPLPLFICSEIYWLCLLLLFLLGTSLFSSDVSILLSFYFLSRHFKSLCISLDLEGSPGWSVFRVHICQTYYDPWYSPTVGLNQSFFSFNCYSQIFCAFPVLSSIEAAAMHVWCPRVVCPHLFVFGVFGNSLTQFYLKCCSWVFGFAS